jgi:signal transduction histidine kinase
VDESNMQGRPFDAVANRALLFVILTAFGVATYAAAVGVLGPQVPVKGADAVLVGGALAAVLLAVRDWAQRGVDWLLYGDRHDPQRAMLRVGRDVASVADPAGLVPILAKTLADSLRLSYLEVRLGATTPPVVVGVAPSRVTELPLLHQGRTLGTLRAGRRGEQLSRSDRRLLAGVAPQLAAAAVTMRLQNSLAAARDRIVRAREEERRRLRHDLHDVLGPALAGVGLGLDAARSRAVRDPEGADELIQEVQGELRDCVGEIRRIIDGLRPPSLDERGLVGALNQHIGMIRQRQQCLHITLRSDELPELPAAVEVVAYLVTQEALTNAMRHSRAERLVIDLGVTGNELRLDIVDDGAGLPAQPARPDGVGLGSMAARAEEIGGRCTISPGRNGGTTISVRLPLQTSRPVTESAATS